MAKKKSKPKQLIPAVAYVRKSTKGKKADGSERQEKSIVQQRAELTKLVKDCYEIVRWYADEGVSGWKRNGKRPQFDQMLRDAKDRGDFVAVVCDDLDRFSRAEVMEVFTDLSALASSGVKTIHCANQGEYGLGDNDIGRIIKMVVDIHGGNEFSRKLSRRVTRAHRDRALEGKRSGKAPYGLANDGNGGLKHGDRKHLAVVRRIFKLFVELKQSMNSIAGNLNAEGIPAPQGGKWYVAGIKELLQRPAYRGDFAFGRRQQGQFYTTDKNRDVVEVNEEINRWQYSEPAIYKKSVYTPVVSKELWDGAKKRLAEFKLKGSRRPRKGGYPLAGVLICGHCGKPMYGCQQKGRSYRVYRCSTPAKSGLGTCGTYEIHEDLILPYVLTMLAEEMDGIHNLLADPPEELVAPGRQRKAEKYFIHQERDALDAKITQAEENLLLASESRTRQNFDKMIAKMYKDLDQLDADLAEDQEPDYRPEELEALDAWWANLYATGLQVPVPGKRPTGSLHHMSNVSVTDNTGDGKVLWDNDGNEVDEEQVFAFANPRVVNEALHMLGAEVRLRWKTTRIKLRTGKEQNRYKLTGGRFRLGQRAGKIACKNGVTVCKAPFEE